jgi:hypothetical protein
VRSREIGINKISELQVAKIRCKKDRFPAFTALRLDQCPGGGDEACLALARARAAFALTPVFPEATLVGALTALSRHLPQA